MPLDCVIERDGKRLKDYVWDYDLLGCFLTAALLEGDPDFPLVVDSFETTIANVIQPDEDGYVKFLNVSMWPIYYMKTECPLWKVGEQTLEYDWKFQAGQGDIELLAGDVLKMWRSSGSVTG